MEEIHNNLKLRLDTFIKTKKIPHIIFYGSDGSGKRYILNYFINKIYKKEDRKQNTMYVNCAHGKGIRFIRDELKFFAKSNLKNKDKFKSIILFNANHLTIDAQSALRRCIEEYSRSTRFFILINNKDQLLQPILSRFCILFVQNPTINSKRINLFNIDEKIYNLKNKISNDKMKFLKTKLKKIKFENLYILVINLYNKGYSALDILRYVDIIDDKNKYLYQLHFNKIKREFRNEKLLMFYIIFFVFLRKDLTLENIIDL